MTGTKLDAIMTMVFGTAVSLRHPETSPMPTIGEVGWHLAHMDRFNGALIKPVSVATHSMAMAVVAPPELRLRCLQHDCSEAVHGDFLAPLIRMQEAHWLRDLVFRWQWRMYDEFSLGKLLPHNEATRTMDPPELQALDAAMARLEAQQFGTPELWASIDALTKHWEEAANEALGGAERAVALQFYQWARQQPRQYMADQWCTEVKEALTAPNATHR